MGKKSTHNCTTLVRIVPKSRSFSETMMFDGVPPHFTLSASEFSRIGRQVHLSGHAVAVAAVVMLLLLLLYINNNNNKEHTIFITILFVGRLCLRSLTVCLYCGAPFTTYTHTQGKEATQKKVCTQKLYYDLFRLVSRIFTTAKFTFISGENKNNLVTVGRLHLLRLFSVLGNWGKFNGAAWFFSFFIVLPAAAATHTQNTYARCVLHTNNNKHGRRRRGEKCVWEWRASGELT